MSEMMTREQIVKAMRENKYISLRDWTGYEMGINCGVLKILVKDKHKSFTGEQLLYQSYRPISLNEYIELKHPFISQV